MKSLSSNIKIGVVGAGSMGAGIAQIAAKAGHTVFLYDQNIEVASKAVINIRQQLERLVSKKKILEQEVDLIVSRIIPVANINDLADCGLIVEAIIEDLNIKQLVFKQLEELCSSNTILASNTSSISITELASKLQHPERFLGMHFFNPAPVMPLVEVIIGLATDPTIAETVYNTANNWGKAPVYAKSTPGFIVNRVARPFYAESLRMLEEQVASIATLDAIIRDAGQFRMGPFELMDLIGHDVNFAVTTSMFNSYFQDPRFKPSLIQKALVESGRLGRKSGSGFYDYNKDSINPTPSQEPQSYSDSNTLIVAGKCNALNGLISRAKACGIEVIEREGSGLLYFGEAVIALTDGRLACDRSRTESLDNLVLLDLAFDYFDATRLCIAVSDQANNQARTDAIAFLQRCGIDTTVCEDSPGLVVMRTLATITNEAADTHFQGVASISDIDAAMRGGVNYPQGPFTWSNRVGVSHVYSVLYNLHLHYGDDRYRPSALLRKLFITRKDFSI